MPRLALILTVLSAVPTAVPAQSRVGWVQITTTAGDTGWGSTTTHCATIDRPGDPRARRLR